MTTVQINCENQWQDYTGGADHRTLEEAHACEAEHRADGEERTHVVIVPIEEYERLLALDAPSAIEQVAIDFPVEDVIVGVLQQLRTIDEDVVRLRLRGHPKDMPMDKRVMDVVGNNGPEYAIIMSTLAGMV